MRKNSWAAYSQREKSDTGAYWSLPTYPTFEPQEDDQQVEVVQRERFETLAEKYLGDKYLWWVILVRNDLNDPLVDLAPGATVTIPSLRYVRERLSNLK